MWRSSWSTIFTRLVTFTLPVARSLPLYVTCEGVHAANGVSGAPYIQTQAKLYCQVESHHCSDRNLK
jgi:hypothetical protein